MQISANVPKAGVKIWGRTFKSPEAQQKAINAAYEFCDQTEFGRENAFFKGYRGGLAQVGAATGGLAGGIAAGAATLSAMAGPGSSGNLVGGLVLGAAAAVAGAFAGGLVGAGVGHGIGWGVDKAREAGGAPEVWFPNGTRDILNPA